MTAQRVIWTACPNGTAPNGNLRISVAIGPQLMPTGTGADACRLPRLGRLARHADHLESNDRDRCR